MTVRISRRILLTAALALAVPALVVACGGSDDTGAVDATSNVQEMRIEARDIAFSPVSLTLDAGEPVRLTLVNVGALEHDVTIPGLNATDDIVEPAGEGGTSHQMIDAMAPGTVHMAAHGGESVMLEFTPRAGQFELYCSIPGHKEAGMVGTVDVQ